MVVSNVRLSNHYPGEETKREKKYSLNGLGETRLEQSLPSPRCNVAA